MFAEVCVLRGVGCQGQGLPRGGEGPGRAASTAAGDRGRGRAGAVGAFGKMLFRPAPEGLDESGFTPGRGGLASCTGKAASAFHERMSGCH